MNEKIYDKIDKIAKTIVIIGMVGLFLPLFVVGFIYDIKLILELCKWLIFSLGMIALFMVVYSLLMLRGVNK